MKIRELFYHDVTRDIPPVVYFHEQKPAKVQQEVSEYIITGGYEENDPRARRVKSGIHEQFVHLLRAIHKELGKQNGPELPASWISGFYGSGKSSFAKLLGLALDGVVLPDGTPLADALLSRDDSPKRQELVDAWKALTAKVHPFAVVFDIGSVARDDEHIHSAVLRQVQIRLGYSRNNLVAEHELKLERSGEWNTFLSTAREVLKKDWTDAKNEEQADDHFSHVLHVMNGERYRDPMSWIDSRAGSRTGAGTSVHEVVQAIEAMIALRAEGKALFLVVDEVSQYVHQDEGRMLKLQSFVSDLGQKLKGAVWLLATGQQKLEDQAENNNIGKLKDRFPPQLRVHLGTTNIRDVVHKRLLRKKTEKESVLRDLFQKHRPDLKVYGYACEEITEEDFVEVYPMLPGHVDLLMQITSAMRTRSSRMRGDDHAIRGLLQLLGELFREQKLADGEVGQLVTLDAIFEVQHSALDADVQTTLARIFNHPEVRDDAVAQRAAKAVALLELIQEQGTQTTPTLVAQCLYSRLGEGNQVTRFTDALEKLRALSLLSYSEKLGYKIQSSAGQEWQRERDDIGVTQEQISKSVQAALKNLVGSTQERPRWRGRTFPWTLWFSDDRQAHDVKLQDAREDSTVAVDFRFLGKKDDRSSTTWVQKSDQNGLRNRVIWVVGESVGIESHARELARSERMLERYRARRESLTPTKKNLLNEEEARFEDLELKVRKAVDEAFLEGTAYFRSQQFRARDVGSSFAGALSTLATRILPDLYPHFTEIAITPTELGQLLEKELAGPSTKFMETGLAILSLDAGKYVATCQGAIPSRILQEVQATGGMTGQALIAMFVSPPYGYAADLVKACCAGLLRGKKLRIRPEQGDDITSYQDPGVRDLFAKDRDFRRAEFFPAIEGEVTQRDRIAIRKFFQTYLQVDLEPEDEPIADAAFLHFPRQRERLREVERRYNDLPGRPAIPVALQKLGQALEECCRSRLVQKTVVEVKRNLDALRDGLEQLGLCHTELTTDAMDAVGVAGRIRDNELAQLRQFEALAGLEDQEAAIVAQLKSERPWRDIQQLKPALERVREEYVEQRKSLLNKQNAEAEAARSRVKMRSGFALLGADEAHRVLRPIAEAVVDTTPDAVAPTLVEVRDRFASRIAKAEELANDRLDEELGKRNDAQIVKVDSQLRGREVQTREHLRAIFTELEERIGPHLDKGIRVRIL